ncbi:MAG TPA: orotidine-5'-phosphate decarboxylase [Bacteroidetes bacterium]|nr:orotidine-5'-phosphate decarboxylase [Bacteroidota bacterium]
MTYEELYSQIRKKRTFLCVGLDTDVNKIPAHLLLEEDPVFAFNRVIIEATLPYAVAYKPNLAFYEAQGTAGWESLKKTLLYLREKAPETFLIADAKRGDIGNTSAMYARTFFSELDADAVTLSPYMGKDTVEPFLQYEDRWVVLLALTSNASAADFQYFEDKNGKKLFEKVLETSREWASKNQVMYVTGATRAKELATVRKLVPEHFLLVPGVGAQGGSLEETARYGMNSRCGLLVNSSRGILYASQGKDFAEKAAAEAEKLQRQMDALLKQHGIL